MNIWENENRRVHVRRRERPLTKDEGEFCLFLKVMLLVFFVLVFKSWWLLVLCKVFVLEILKLESTRLRLEAFSLAARRYFIEAMPVLGVASKLRQPAVGSKPVHTALPIPSLGTPGSQHYSSSPLELTESESSVLSCKLTLHSTCECEETKPVQGKAEETEDSKVSVWRLSTDLWSENANFLFGGL